MGDYQSVAPVCDDALCAGAFLWGFAVGAIAVMFGAVVAVFWDKTK